MTWMHVLIATGAGGLALFAWNAIVWMALHYHDSDFRRMPKAGDVEKALEGAGVTAGIYVMPHQEDFPGGMKDAAFHERWKKGPNAMLVVSAPGPCMGGGTFVAGLVVNLLEALGVAVAFKYAEVNLFDTLRQVGFCAMLGGLVHGGPYLAQAVWVRFPWSHAVKSTLDGVVGFSLVGVILHFLR